MGRSPLFAQFRRVLSLARLAEGRKLSTDDALAEAAAAAERRAISRRELIKRAGLAGAGVALAAATGKARAARRVNASVAVVGAGMAGLACVDTLAKNGVVATLYEAGHRAGGRMHSLGGTFVGPVTMPG